VGGVLPQRLRPLVAGDTTGDLATGSAGRRLDRLALTRAVCLRSENRLLASSHVMSGHCCHRLHASAADSGAGEGAGEGMSSSVDGTVVDVGSPSTAGASAAVSAWIVSVGDRAGDVGAGLASAADALAGEPAGDEADDDGVGSAISTDGSAASAEGAGLICRSADADDRRRRPTDLVGSYSSDGRGCRWRRCGLRNSRLGSSFGFELFGRCLGVEEDLNVRMRAAWWRKLGLDRGKEVEGRHGRLSKRAESEGGLALRHRSNTMGRQQEEIGQFGTISTDLGKRLQLLVLSLGCDRVAALLGSRSERLATDVGQCVLSFDAHGVALEVIQPATSEISRVRTEEPGEGT
jgi:hypothetical protein